MYGREPWKRTRKSRNILLTRERKIPRKPFGSIIEDDTWRKITNRELKTIYMITDIKARRLEWVGHVNRIHSNKFTIVTSDYRLYYKMSNDLD